jgi:PAS domain S-box-containing protein
MDTLTLQKIAAGTSDAIIIQTEGRFTWMNPAACRLFGTELPETLTGTLLMDRIHPDWHDIVLERIRSCNDGRLSAKELPEHKITRIDGSEVWIESSEEPVTYNGKKGALIFMRDISRLKETEKRRHDIELRSTVALAASGIGIWEHDIKNNTASRSLTHDNIFGYDKKLPRWSYKIFLRHVHPMDRRGVHDKFKVAEKTRKDWNFECRIIRKDGVIRWIWAAGRFTASNAGEPGRMIGVVQDITLRRYAEETLKSSYALLGIAGKIARFGGWSFNVSDNIDNLGNETVNWSDAVADINGLPRVDSMLIKDVIGFYTPEWREKLTRVFVECAEKGTPFDEESEIINRKGKRIWIRTIGEAVMEGGKIVKVQGAFQDISPIKLAEKELIESEEKFRNVFQNHAAVKLLVDPDTGNIVEANVAAARFYGWRVEELKKMNISQINTLSKEEIKAETDRAGRLINTNFNSRHRKADGEIRDVEVFTSKIEIGGRVFLHSIVHDVTQKKRAEKQLNLLSRSVEQNPVSISITDTNGYFEYVNPVFEKITGYSLAEIKGKTPRILKSGYHSKEFYKDLWNTILSGKDWKGELKNKRKNGELYWIQAIISPILDNEGKVTNFISTREDITERKKMAEDLIAAKEKAEENDRLKSAFLANISHEIRTPMNGIMGFAEILKEPGLTKKKQRKFIDIIRDSGNRMLDTVNDLIDISKIETGQVAMHFSKTNLKEQLENLIDFFKIQADQKDLKLILKDPVPDDCAVMKTDRSKLDSILTNLIRNAIKFTDKGKIEVGCTKKVNFLEYYVSDTGIGVPRSKQKVIFNRFEQAAKPFNGSGLGLTISKAYAELLGGTIRVVSEEGSGSAFYVTIPLIDIKAQSLNRTAEKALKKDSKETVKRKGTGTGTGKVKGAEKDEGTGNLHGIGKEKGEGAGQLHWKGIPQLKGKKILVAEDDPYSLNMIVYQLKKTGATLITATDGREAVNVFQQGSIDMVLLDIRLPELDGYEVLRHLRSRDPAVPVIAQSAYAMVDDIKKAGEAGFTDYLTKPIDQAKLYGMLARYLFRHLSSQEENSGSGQIGGTDPSAKS